MKNHKFKILVELEGKGIYGEMEPRKSDIREMVEQDSHIWGENTDLKVKKIKVIGK